MSLIIDAHTGIVIVSYNAPEAVAMTLDSLVEIPAGARFSVALIDNASAPEARALIAKSMNRHLDAGHFSGRLFQLDTNKGFSGGNNVGIAYFLTQPDITHICLLNSDVVVSDHWLGYLLEGSHDAVGPLTNASNNEQGIPVPYAISKENGELRFDAEGYRVFAAERRAAWQGCSYPSEFISFFCTLFRKEVIQKVGYLDTRFYPGAYEDDDYCMRILENGFSMHVQRDVFMHHWGSASFSKLEMSDRQHHGLRNRERFAAKYRRPWQDRTHLSWRAWLHDAIFAFDHPGRIEACFPALRLYEKEIVKPAQALDSRYDALAKTTGRHAPHAANDSLRSRTERFAANLQQSFSVGSAKEERQRLVNGGKELENAVAQISAACAEMEMLASAESNARVTPPSLTQGSDGAEALWEVLQGITQGVVFFAGYPFPERLKDGYFQRVAAIDALLPVSHCRIYCDVSEAFTDDDAIQILSDNTILLQVHPHNVMHQLLVSSAVLRCKKIYYHSVLRMTYPIQRMWLQEEGIQKVLDIHGVVPEEFIYCWENYTSASFYNEYESIALRQCDTLVVVSQAMRTHLEEKHASEYRNKMITLPILPAITPVEPSPLGEGEEVRIVYAGGSHPWQCIPRMLEAIETVIETAQVDIFATDPDDFLKWIPQALLEHPRFTLTTATHDELCTRYPTYHYGFLLRDDVAVNRAACPTKLVEYLASCIVPILDSEKIGDFAALGMKYLPVNDLVAGKLLSPEKYLAYVKHNLTVLETLKEHAVAGMLRLREQIVDDDNWETAQNVPSELF